MWIGGGGRGSTGSLTDEARKAVALFHEKEPCLRGYSRVAPDRRDGAVRQARGDPTVAIDRAEHRALGDAGGLQPGPQHSETGQVGVPVATTPTTWPAASWSVLLCATASVAPPSGSLRRPRDDTKHELAPLCSTGGSRLTRPLGYYRGSPTNPGHRGRSRRARHLPALLAMNATQSLLSKVARVGAILLVWPIWVLPDQFWPSGEEQTSTSLPALLAMNATQSSLSKVARVGAIWLVWPIWVLPDQFWPSGEEQTSTSLPALLRR